MLRSSSYHQISHRKISIRTCAQWSFLTNSRNKLIQPLGSFYHFLFRYYRDKNNHGKPRCTTVNQCSKNRDLDFDQVSTFGPKLNHNQI